MKDVALKYWGLALGVAAGATGVYILGSERTAELTKDDTGSEIALTIVATAVLFKVQWWLMDKIIPYAKKAIAPLVR